MSISKQIIYGADAEVLAALRAQQGTPVDVIDEYGYTPLIQATIVNSPVKAKLLLEAGASLNFQDLTGRTALHWAAENGNFEISKLLLQNGADPNAYTYAGQPALAVPILRKHNRLKRLLLDKNADLDFAHDFINTKLLGHRFSLEGRVDIVDHKNNFLEIELEGFYLEFTLEIIVASLIEFRKNFGGKHLKKYFIYLDVIVQALQNAAELIKYQHYLINIKQYETRINRVLTNDLLMLPLAFSGHAISLIKFNDLLIRCDRGAFGKSHGTVIFYEMQNPNALNNDLCKQLLYKRQAPEFINEGLTQYLNLTPRYQFPLPLQKTGNCSWANVEAVIPVLMFLLLLEIKGEHTIEECTKEALNFYTEWQEWDQNRALHFCLESFSETTPARKAAKAALLAAIMFQSCDYNNANDHERAKKIMSVLANAEYKYITDSYLETFALEKSPNIKSFSDFLDDYKKYENK